MKFKLTRGFNRNVILIGNYAIKFPRNFLGLTSNLNEVVRWEYDRKRRNLRCPVLYGSSIIVIMKRCKPCPEELFETIPDDFKIINDYHKDNFGVLRIETNHGYEEKVVCLDYGNNLVFSTILSENNYPDEFKKIA
jgi:hypothetical protein